MYLSRVELDETRRATMRGLASPRIFHGAVESAFPPGRRRRLWRLDRLHGKLYLLLLSEDVPDLSGIASQFGPPGGQGAIQTRDYTPLLQRIQLDGLWQFRLTANPTKSCPRKSDPQARGKVLAHCTVEYQKQWLLERAQKHGFSLEPEEFTVTKVRWLHFPKVREGGRLVTLLAVTYEGTLRVTDPALFQALLVNGIGRGKAYGLGLMTVMGRR